MTGTAADDVLAPASHPLMGARRCLASADLSERISDRGQPVDAGAALAGGLLGEIRRDPRGFGEPAVAADRRS
jgi:hypothetical protein